MDLANKFGALQLEISASAVKRMALVERPPSEQESLSALSRTDSSLSDNSSVERGAAAGITS